MAGRQFGRYCLLKFTNFATKKTWTIDGSKLRITFDFFKSYDEVDTASTGEINIYGLTQETQVALGNRIGDMFQTEVTCIVGYSSDPNNIQVLFKAVVMNNFRVRESGIYVTKIQVSANYKDWRLSGAKSFSFKNERLLKVLGDSLDYFGAGWALSLAGISEADRPFVEEYLMNLVLPNFSFTGTLGELVERFCIEFGMRVITEDAEFEKYGVEKPDQSLSSEPIYTFIFSSPVFVKIMVNDGRKRIEYSKKNIDAELRSTKNINVKGTSTKNPLEYLFKADNVKTATVLDFNSGLLERPYLDNRNIKVPYNRKLQSNEAIDEKKEQKTKVSKATGKPIIDKKTGKAKIYTPKTMVINRRFLSAKALINPSVKPNSQVKININDSQFDGIYRVRNIKFTGDTWDGGWVMDMELEDTQDFREPTTAALASEQESQEQELEAVSDNYTPSEKGALDSE